MLIFAHHHSVHDRLAEALRKALDQPDQQLIHITGLTSNSKRDELLTKFKTERRCRFALLSLTACSQGLNLTEASTCVFAELCWTPAMIDQAESRIHRMGQQAAAVNLYYLLATSSKFAGDDDRLPDGAMFGALVKKAQVASRVVDHAAASSLADAQVVTPRPRAARREEADDDAGGADGEMPTPPRAGRRADAADPPGARGGRAPPRRRAAAESLWWRPPPLRALRNCSVGSRTRADDRMAREDASRLAARAEHGARRGGASRGGGGAAGAELGAAVAAAAAVPEAPRRVRPR